ncbi:MAG TPA: RnfH family protein [Burkholderiaceae bacterium]|nr:RnfH family protein [Burkholderiaceae bacterium]
MIVTVVYAGSKRRIVLRVDVDDGVTIEQAIIASGVLSLEPGLHLKDLSVGVWNRAARLEQRVCEGDRIEIYRPLQVDPKEARRLRADIRRRRPPDGGA